TGELRCVLPKVLGGETMQDDRARGGSDDAEGDQRALATGDIGEHERAVRALAVQSIKFLGGQSGDRRDRTDNCMARHGTMTTRDDFSSIDCIVEGVETHWRRILAKVADDIAFEAGREHACVLAEVVAATLFVDIEQAGDDAPHDADTRIPTTTAFVIGYHRRRNSEFVG